MEREVSCSSLTNAWSQVCGRDQQLVGVVPEVNLKERLTRMPLSSANKAKPTLALKPRADVIRSPNKGVSVVPQNDLCPPFFNVK